MTAQRDEVSTLIEEEMVKQDSDKTLVKNYKQQIRDIEQKIQTVQSEAVKIIDLDNKAFIFLDTPDENSFNNLLSILSQDFREQLYLFTKIHRVREFRQEPYCLGAPLVMTTQVVDYTRNYRFQEKNRRFINVNLNPTESKIQEAIRQISIRLGGIEEDFEQIVSNENIDKSKDIVKNLCKKRRQHTSLCLQNKTKGNGVLLPYYYVFSECLPKETWYVTVLTRLANYIAIITKVNMDSRPKVVDTKTGMVYPISIYSDFTRSATANEDCLTKRKTISL